MTVIGITGGTGAGKTTALDAITELDGIVIDCDAVYHELLENDAEMLGELRDSFPDAFPNGVFDRKALGRIVFADADKLLLLNEITHKYVDREVDKRIAGFAAQGGTLAAVDAIALLEAGLVKKCNVSVFVTAPKEVRAQRIMAREGISREYAMMRIDAQKDDEYFSSRCDVTLNNDGTMSKEAFTEYCKKIFSDICNK